MDVKVKTFRVPNLDYESDVYSCDDLEEEIENHIKIRLEDGYTLTNVTSGDAFVILVFTKED